MAEKHKNRLIPAWLTSVVYYVLIGTLIVVLAFVAIVISQPTSRREVALLAAEPYLTEEQRATLAEYDAGVPIPDDCGYWGVSGAWHPYEKCISETASFSPNQPRDGNAGSVGGNCAEAVDCVVCLREKYGFGSLFSPCQLCASVWMGMWYEGCVCCEKIGR